MSRRQLRRLQQAKEPFLGSADTDVVVDDQIVDIPRTRSFTSFAALAASDDNDNDDSDSDNGDMDDMVAAGDVEAQKAAPAANRGACSRAWAKRRKNAKAKAKKEAAAAAAAAAPRAADVDDISKALRELGIEEGPSENEKPDGPAEKAEKAARERLCGLLKVSSYKLKMDNEMISMYGRDTIKAAEASMPAPRQQGGRPDEAVDPELGSLNSLNGTFDVEPPHGLRQKAITDNFFIRGKKTWPMAGTEGMCMRKRGHKFFITQRDDQDKYPDLVFHVMASTGDAGEMIEYLLRHPYHPPALLTVSKMASVFHEERPVATDLLERALFSTGRILTPEFKRMMEKGTAQMDFNEVYCRQFWLVGHRYLLSLTRCGAHRTALEWAKLLLMLDTTDPSAVGQLIHVAAIRAREFKLVIDLCETGVLDPHWGYPAQTAGLARLRMKDRDGAIDTIRAGMRVMPWLYGALFRALNLDIPPSIWGRMAPGKADELYTHFYVRQTKNLWGTPAAVDVLKAAAGGLEEIPRTFGRVAKKIPLGMVRLMYIDDDAETLALVPSAQLHRRPIVEFDPFPPPGAATTRLNGLISSTQYASRRMPFLPARDRENSMQFRRVYRESDLYDASQFPQGRPNVTMTVTSYVMPGRLDSAAEEDDVGERPGQ